MAGYAGLQFFERLPPQRGESARSGRLWKVLALQNVRSVALLRRIKHVGVDIAVRDASSYPELRRKFLIPLPHDVQAQKWPQAIFLIN